MEKKNGKRGHLLLLLFFLLFACNRTYIIGIINKNVNISDKINFDVYIYIFIALSMYFIYMIKKKILYNKSYNIIKISICVDVMYNQIYMGRSDDILNISGQMSDRFSNFTLKFRIICRNYFMYFMSIFVCLSYANIKTKFIWIMEQSF